MQWLLKSIIVFFDKNQKSCCRIAGYLDVRQGLETIFFQKNLWDIAIERIRDEAKLFTTDIKSEDETEDHSDASIDQRPITNLICKGDSKPGLTSSSDSWNRNFIQVEPYIIQKIF